jgi:hypothetical protein
VDVLRVENVNRDPELVSSSRSVLLGERLRLRLCIKKRLARDAGYRAAPLDRRSGVSGGKITVQRLDSLQELRNHRYELRIGHALASFAKQVQRFLSRGKLNRVQFAHRRIRSPIGVILQKNQSRKMAACLNVLSDDVMSAGELRVNPDSLCSGVGAHQRVQELERHHQARFQDVMDSLKEKPKAAGELLGVLFRRPLDTHQTFFAMGEAIAHLHYLYYAGRAERTLGNDGIMRYATRQ